MTKKTENPFFLSTFLSKKTTKTAGLLLAILIVTPTVGFICDNTSDINKYNKPSTFTVPFMNKKLQAGIGTQVGSIAGAGYATLGILVGITALANRRKLVR